MKTVSGTQVRTFSILAGLALLALGNAAIAAPTLLGTTTNPTGIDGLVVDGVTYNLSFGNTPDSTTFSYQSPGALDASNALATALNGLGVNGLQGAACTGLASSCADALYVDAPLSNLADAAVLAPSLLSSLWVNNFGNAVCVAGLSACLVSVGEFVTWTRPATSVPEPATLLLFGLGLVGAGLQRRRRAR